MRIQEMLLLAGGAFGKGDGQRQVSVNFDERQGDRSIHIQTMNLPGRFPLL